MKALQDWHRYLPISSGGMVPVGGSRGKGRRERARGRERCYLRSLLLGQIKAVESMWGLVSILVLWMDYCIY